MADDAEVLHLDPGYPGGVAEPPPGARGEAAEHPGCQPQLRGHVDSLYDSLVTAYLRGHVAPARVSGDHAAAPASRRSM